MDSQTLLARFDEQMRRQIVYHDAERQALARVVRHRSLTGDVSFVLHTVLNEENADDEIAAQLAYFQAINAPFEWKVYAYDQPPDLRQRLATSGFEVDEAEAVMVLDLAAQAPAPNNDIDGAGIQVRQIENDEGIAHAAAIVEEVWPGRGARLRQRLAADLRAMPDLFALYVAYLDGEPASTAWIHFHANSDFASLWGGSTRPGWRGRGLYSALVHARASAALARKVRFLTVDARSTSRPILEKMGFTTLTHAYACTWRPPTRP